MRVLVSASVRGPVGCVRDNEHHWKRFAGQSWRGKRGKCDGKWEFEAAGGMFLEFEIEAKDLDRKDAAHRARVHLSKHFIAWWRLVALWSSLSCSASRMSSD